MGACDYCGIERKKLKACSRCKSAHFCNKTCFTAAWKAGHKAECNKKKKEAEEDDDLKQRMDSESYLDNPHALFYDVPIHPQYADELEDHLGMPFCPDER